MSVRAGAVFQAIGFAPQELRHHACPGGDEAHDRMFLAHPIGDTLAELVTTGVAKVLG